MISPIAQIKIAHLKVNRGKKICNFFLCYCSQAGRMDHVPEIGAARPEQGGRKVLRGRKKRAGFGREGGLGGHGCTRQAAAEEPTPNSETQKN